MLALSELQMVGLPKYRFDLNSWRIFDPFMKFGHFVMLRTIQNLVVNDALLCSGESSMTLQVGNISSESPVGFLEEIILKEVVANPGCSVGDCMNWCFTSLMDNNTAVNPAKYMFGKIIRSNRFQYWQWTETNGWFSQKMEINISPSVVEMMNKKLANASEKAQTQINQNPKLSLYFQEFSNAIDRQLTRWTDST